MLIRYNVKALTRQLDVEVPKAKVEVPSIEVVAQILEELDYKPLGWKNGPWGKLLGFNAKPPRKGG